jgi:hypothetical protein
MQSKKVTASAGGRVAANENHRIRIVRLNTAAAIPEHRPRQKPGHSNKTTTRFRRDAAGCFLRDINRQQQAPDDVMVEVAPNRYLNQATAQALGFAYGHQSHARAADARVESYLVPSAPEKDVPFDKSTTPQERILARAVVLHKRVVEDWRLSCWRAAFEFRQSAGDPACDDFHPPVRVSDTPRHRGLSERLASLLTWRAASRPTVELVTNWRLVPKNGERGADEEDIPEEEDEPQRQLERDRLMDTRPNVKQMLQMFGDGLDIDRGTGVRRTQPSQWPTKEQKVPGPAIRINGLRFSNGAAEESCYVLKAGRVVWGKVKMPTGSLMFYGAAPGRRGFRTVDKFTEMRGPDDDEDRSVSAKEELDVSNAFWATELRTQPHRYIPSDRRRRRKRIMSQADQIQLLADNDNWPPVTKYPAGLPCGQKRAADAFLGGCHASTGNCGSVGNPHPVMDRLEAEEIRASISEADRCVLDKALTAQTFEDIGKFVGKTGKNAERVGKQALLDATGRLAHALNKVAA